MMGDLPFPRSRSPCPPSRRRSGRRPLRPGAATSSRLGYVSWPGDGSPSGCCWPTRPTVTGRSKPREATIWSWPSTIWAKRDAEGWCGPTVHRVRGGRRRHDSSGAPMSGCLRAQSAVCSCIRSMYASS